MTGESIDELSSDPHAASLSLNATLQDILNTQFFCYLLAVRNLLRHHDGQRSDVVALGLAFPVVMALPDQLPAVFLPVGGGHLGDVFHLLDEPLLDGLEQRLAKYHVREILVSHIAGAGNPQRIAKAILQR